MGQGDRKYADQVAVEAMRQEMETVDIDGTIVIGEGERDEAPMLYIGEKVGKGRLPRSTSPSTRSRAPNLCATGAPNAIAGAGRVREGRPRSTPRTSTWRSSWSARPSGARSTSTRPSRSNLQGASREALDREVDDLVVDRARPPAPRARSIADIRKAGARIRLIGDGDLSAGISAAVRGHAASTR